MGIKTASFPHLGLYGDVFILNNKKGERIVFEDHSALKKKQDEYDKWMAQKAKKIQQEVLKPDKEKGEEILSFPDESFSEKYEDDRAYLIPDALIPDEEAGEELITMTDDIPFLKRWNVDLSKDKVV
jgi:TRAP-type C4-dicarboxylate transport system substrate-binding protein